MATTTDERATTRWPDRMLTGTLLAVGAYAGALVLIGDRVDELVFDPLGFGSSDTAPEVAASHARLLRGVLGAVIVGWTTLLLAIARGPLRARERWAWQAVIASLATWFTIDTGFSLVVGEWQHALFNLGFAGALAIPLLAVRSELR